MLPWFNHQATITIEKSNPEMSALQFVMWCAGAVARLQTTAWTPNRSVIKDKRFKIGYEYMFDPKDDTVKALDITVTGLTKKGAFAICCVASMFNEMKVTTFYK